MEIETISLIAVIVTLSGYIIYDRLTRNREKISRYANSCNDFRNSILDSVSHVPPARKHWENDVLVSMSNVIMDIDLAIGKFKVFLLKNDQDRLEKEWAALKKHIENIIPDALSRPALLYGGGAPIAKEVKEKFHNRVQNILLFANKI